jgi:murein L,D-transpeptidase YcbB/YkuD
VGRIRHAAVDPSSRPLRTRPARRAAPRAFAPTRGYAKPSRVVHAIALLGLLLGAAVHAQQPAAEPPLSPVAEQIRDRVEQWRGAHADADAPGQAVADFYEQNRFAPAWTRPGDLDQLLAALRDVAGNGLDPEDYGLSELQRRRVVPGDPQATPQQRAQFDLLATDACLAALGRPRVSPWLSAAATQP